MKSKVYKLLILLFGLFLVNSCTKDFEEINKNNNVPALEQADPAQLLTNSIESMTDRVHEIFLGHEMGSCWVQHMAKVQYTDEDRYIYRPDVLNNTWASLYGASGMDVELIRRISVANELDNYKAVSYVLRAYIVSLLTDMFGDVPYTEAWKAIDDINATLPAYDSQESIYRDLISKLDSVNILLSADKETLKGDILYGGDLTKWRKFANTLRLRLLLRMSSKDETFVTTEMSKMIQNPTDYPIFAGNADNAALVYLGSSPNNNPINENRKTRDDHRVSKTLLDMMYWANPYVDWRVSVYANVGADSQDYYGLPNGLLASDALNYMGNGLSMTSKLGNYFTAASAPGMLMSYAETEFILAEAAVKGYIPGGLTTAKSYYEKGVYGSYNQFPTATSARSVFGTGQIKSNWTNDSCALDHMTRGGYGFDETTLTNEEALELIATQKWLSMFDQGLQAFIEYRRTGFPVLVAPAEGNNGDLVPSRYPYPTDEKSRNGANLNSAVGAQGFSALDDLNGKVWWNKP